MYHREIALGTLGYTIATFTLAVVWHVVLFEDLYREFGYFKGQPNFGAGFVTILIQGLIVSFCYPYLSISGGNFVKGLKVSYLFGLYLWTSHVLGFVAKQNVERVALFIPMESFYLLLQFTLFGLLIGFIYRHK